MSYRSKTLTGKQFFCVNGVTDSGFGRIRYNYLDNQTDVVMQERTKSDEPVQDYLEMVKALEKKSSSKKKGKMQTVADAQKRLSIKLVNENLTVETIDVILEALSLNNERNEFKGFAQQSLESA